jgi:hypothetical protein
MCLLAGQSYFFASFGLLVFAQVPARADELFHLYAAGSLADAMRALARGFGSSRGECGAAGIRGRPGCCEYA